MAATSTEPRCAPMARSSISVAIAAVSQAAFRGELGAAGFRRQGNYLLRDSREPIHGINFQASRGNAVPLSRFTVNLIVTSESLYRYWTAKPLPRNPITTLFPVRHRIGPFSPDKGGWWDVDDGTDIDKLCHEVVDVLLRQGLPFFADFQSHAMFLDRLRQGRGVPGTTRALGYLIHGMLAKDQGFEDEARRELQKAISGAELSPFGQNVLAIAGRSGISGVGGDEHRN
jgi:Domain of unknown function (DUF4304)